MRKFDDEFLIVDLPVLLPDEGVRIEPEDILAGESGQDESGYMHIIPLRTDVLKLSVYYPRRIPVHGIPLQRQAHIQRTVSESGWRH